MKKIIFITIALSFGFALAKDKAKSGRKISQEETTTQQSELKKKFLDQTKLEEGEYTLDEKSDESCASGPLTVMDADEGSKAEVFITIGAVNLVENLGKEKFTEKEEECTVTVETSYNDVAIKERIERECPNSKKSVFHTNLTLKKGKISYVKEIYEGEKILETTKCNLTRVAPIQVLESDVVEKADVKKDSTIKFKKIEK